MIANTNRAVLSTPLPEPDLPSVLGQSEAALLPAPRRWLQRCFGFLDIHTRLKWGLLRPFLRALPERNVRILDAGCGTGRWALELAARRPHWTIVGVDLDAGAIAAARLRQERLKLKNVSFEVASFLQFQPEEPFDVLLSIASAHYLARAGHAEALFACFADWVSTGGTLLLYGPRDPKAVPTIGWLPGLSNDWGFSREYLLELTSKAGFQVDGPGTYGPFPVIGRWGTVAKQIAIATDHNVLLRALAYPIAFCLGSLERSELEGDAPSSAWLLVGRRGGQ